MNTDSYKVLKLSNGEMIVCEINDYDDKIYDIMNPLRMDVIPIKSRNGGIGETLNLTPWMQHFTDQKYFNIEKNQCILIADASVGLSKYYEYVMLRIDDSWDKIRATMSTQMRITTSLRDEHDRQIHVRKSTRPNAQQKKLLNALNLPCLLGRTEKTVMGV